jgi:hypothetical protein
MFHYLLLVACVAFLMSQNGRRNRRKHIETLIRQAARYSTAALQDESPIIALLHANYSAAYFYALRDIASEDEIHNATGIDVKKFKRHITASQDAVTKKVHEMCPTVKGKVDLYLAAIGGEA